MDRKPPSQGKLDRSKLRRWLAERFSRDELQTLCFDLELEYEDLPETKEALSRELVASCARRKLIPTLLSMCRQARPDENWDEVWLPAQAKLAPDVDESDAPDGEEDDDVSLTFPGCLIGAWQVQVMTPYLGVTAQGTVQLFPNFTFRGQFMAALGVATIQGQWQVTAPQQVLLQGQQMLGFQVGPYMAMIQFGQITPVQLTGFTSTGEQVIWQRVA